MKIVHICLANFYIDKMSYQENLLPKFHALVHNVTIITSDYSFDCYGQKQKKEKTEYINEHGIKVFVLQRSTRYGYYSRFNDFEGLYEHLSDLSPDIIFCHGGQFIALKDVLKYCKKNKNVKLYIDQHADYYNTPVDTLKNRIVHKYIYGHWMRKAVPYVTKFWGVTPWRCQFLHEVYGLPREKIDLLIMGGDDERIHLDDQEHIRKEIREKYNIAADDFLIITGGKIDRNKNIHSLIEAVKAVGDQSIKLLVFGQASKDFETEFSAVVASCNSVRYIGWLPSESVYDYFLASDLAAFPGTHSVLWEQACACGIPGMFKKWEGMRHVDVGGNVVFLNENSAEEIKEKLLYILAHKEAYEHMKSAAVKGREHFSYKAIARRAIGEETKC